MSRANALLWTALILFLASIGCDKRPTRIKPPAINPQQAAQEALAEYDTNGDGAIDGPELDKTPALKSALKDMDKNGDNKISADEIIERIEQWQASKVAIMSMTCKILLDKSPLEGATVTMVPEKFLGPNVQPASGTTNDQGFVTLSIAKDKLPNPNFSGMNVGLYRVEVTKDQNGQQVIPARYNVNTELGIEVAQGNPALTTGVTFELKSKWPLGGRG